MWSDEERNSTIALEDYLTNIMIYWVTNSIYTSVRLYKEDIFTSVKAFQFSTDNDVIQTKAGLVEFPGELFKAAGGEYGASGTYRNLVRYSIAERGGHFAALEQPAFLYNDLMQFIEQLS